MEIVAGVLVISRSRKAPGLVKGEVGSQSHIYSCFTGTSSTRLGLVWFCLTRSAVCVRLLCFESMLQQRS